MDFAGHESDQSEDIFSDDDGTGDVKFSSPAARGNISFLHLSQTPVLVSQQKQETPGKAIVPKTPLSLAPFLSKAGAWSSDLETPEGKQDSIMNRTKIASPNTPNFIAHDMTLVPEQICTPIVNDEGTEEIVPLSQEIPKSNSRKPKRPPKRRIFGKNTSFSLALHDEDVFSGNQSYEESKENEVRKSQSCIETGSLTKSTLVNRLEQLKELHRKLRERNEIDQVKQELVISDDEFLKKTRELEMCDKILPKVDNKENEAACGSEVEVLSSPDNILLSQEWDEFEEQNQTLVENELQNVEENEQMKTVVEIEEGMRNEVNPQMEESFRNHMDSPAEMLSQNRQGYNSSQSNSETSEKFSNENFEMHGNFVVDKNIQNEEISQTDLLSQKMESNCQIKENSLRDGDLQNETLSQCFTNLSQIKKPSLTGDHFQNEDFENEEISVANDFEGNGKTSQNSQFSEEFFQAEQNFQLEEKYSNVDMLNKDDQFSQIDFGLADMEEDVCLDDTIIVKELSDGNKTEEEVEDKIPDDEDGFRGFSVEAQGSRELWYFQQLFRAYCADGLDKIQEREFKGFSFTEAETARTIAINNEILLANYLEKYYGIIQSVEDDVEKIESLESQSSEGCFELPILSPLVVTVYSGFDTGSSKKLFINVEKIVKAQSILLKDENVTAHSIDLLIDSGDLENKTNVEVCDNNDESHRENKEIDKIVDNEEISEKIEYSNEIVDNFESMEIDEPSSEQPSEKSRRNSENSDDKENCERKIENVGAPLNPTKSATNFPSCVGFHTALGNPVEISEKALSMAKSAYNGDFSKDYTDCLNELTNLKTKARLNRTQAGGFKPVIPRIASIKLAGKISSDKNEENKISDLALTSKDSDKKLGDFKSTLSVNKQPPIPDNFQSTNDPGFVGFTTGLGKAVPVSEEALLRSKAIFAQVEKEVDDNFEMTKEITVNKPVVIPTASSKISGSGAFPPRRSGLQRPITPSMAKPFVPLHVKRPDVFNSPVPSTSTGILPIPSTSGFTTGSGKKMIVSEEALARSKQLYTETERETALEFEKAGQIEAAPEATNPPIKRPTSKPFTPLNPKRPLTPTVVGFTTGNGAAIKISEVAFKKMQADMEEFATDLDSDKNLEDLSKIKQKMWSSRHKQTDSVTGKRKNMSDDVTPAGRKRARTGCSDLQARVLFSEIDEEDDELKQSALAIDFNQDNNNDRNLPFKEEVSAEVRACTDAFMEDFERTTVKNRWSDSYTIVNTRIIQRRPRSLPDQLKIPKKNTNSLDAELIPDDVVFDSQDFLEFSDKISTKLRINESLEVRRRDAIARQEELIKHKMKNREKQIPGSLLSLKKEKSRMSLQSLCHRGSFPIQRSVAELPEKVDPSVLSITPATAVNYQFNLEDFYSRGANYTEGIPAGDGASLIPNEANLAGLDEIERAFLSSPGVDPNLLPQGWVENHYKWIIWKLASMDRMKFNRVEINRCLTPDQVLKQLKYRYDREIDRAERPILRRIFEKDESPSHRMILCVSKIEKLSIENEIRFTLQLTDGWYSINALIDNPMINYIISGKIKLGTKLMIYGAQLVNLEEGCHPLESPEAVRLKINTNSTRRAKWYAKLGLQKYGGPMELSLGRVNPAGGLIGKVSAIVSRVYPIIYKETLSDGQIIYRNSKSEEKRQMLNDEQVSMVHRDIKPCLKIRIDDASGTTGIMTIWQNAMECSEMFKEGNSIIFNHATACGRRSNELQINATRWTTFRVNECKKFVAMPFAKRIFTPLSETMSQYFSPNYGEFDTVGIVVSIGPAPHGMRNFETVNLAWRSQDNTDSFMSLLFWEGVSSYGYSDIATVGSIICCMNCEWRRNTYRSIPTAFCSERTIITRNPRQGSHLKGEFDCLGYRIGDVHNYVDDCASKIQAEVMKKSGSTPIVITPRRVNTNSIDSTPKNRRSSVIQEKIEKLQSYAAPPKLSPINLTRSNRISLDFKSPLSKPPKT